MLIQAEKREKLLRCVLELGWALTATRGGQRCGACAVLLGVPTSAGYRGGVAGGASGAGGVLCGEATVLGCCGEEVLPTAMVLEGAVLLRMWVGCIMVGLEAQVAVSRGRWWSGWRCWWDCRRSEGGYIACTGRGSSMRRPFLLAMLLFWAALNHGGAEAGASELRRCDAAAQKRRVAMAQRRRGTKH